MRKIGLFGKRIRAVLSSEGLNRLEFSSKSAIMIASKSWGVRMAQILVRNLDDGLKGRLQRRAKLHGQSMEAEVRDILRDALRAEEAPAGGLGSEIVAMFSGSGVYLDEPIQEIRGMKMEIPEFEP